MRLLVRPSSRDRAPQGCSVVLGDALDARTFARSVAPADTFIQLVGVASPSPAKAARFREIDLASVTASVEAARSAGVAHFVYLSVAQPAPVMRAYVEVRAAGEALIRDSGMAATFLRPWYVLGPGHRWPIVLAPAYWVAERLPATAETARRLGLVTLGQMLSAIVEAVESPPAGVRVVEVPAIRAARLVQESKPTES